MQESFLSAGIADVSADNTVVEKQKEKRLKNTIFQSRDLCLRALDTNSICAKGVRRKEEIHGKIY